MNRTLYLYINLFYAWGRNVIMIINVNLTMLMLIMCSQLFSCGNYLVEDLVPYLQDIVENHVARYCNRYQNEMKKISWRHEATIPTPFRRNQWTTMEGVPYITIMTWQKFGWSVWLFCQLKSHEVEEELQVIIFFYLIVSLFW